jgi:hypothetical protein
MGEVIIATRVAISYHPVEPSSHQSTLTHRSSTTAAEEHPQYLVGC